MKSENIFEIQKSLEEEMVYTGIEKFKVNNIEYNDKIFNCDLHEVKSSIVRPNYHVSDILPDKVIRKYSEMKFW